MPPIQSVMMASLSSAIVVLLVDAAVTAGLIMEFCSLLQILVEASFFVPNTPTPWTNATKGNVCTCASVGEEWSTILERCKGINT